MANNEVKIPISLPGAGKAAQDAKGVAAGLDQVGNAAQKGSKATGEQAKQAQESTKRLNELGEASEKGAAVGRLLGEVTRGNVFALAQLGSVLKATGAAVKTSVFGIVLIGATALLNFLPGLIARLKGTKDEVDETAKSADALAAAFEKAGKARGSALTAELENIKEQAKGAADELERVMRLQKAINAAKGEDVERDRNLEDLALGQTYSAARDTRDRNADVLAKATEQLDEFTKSVATARQQMDERQSLERELARTPSRLFELQENGQRIDMGANPRYDEITARLAGIPAVSDEFLRGQEGRLNSASASVFSARRAADASEADLSRLGRDVVGLRADGSAIRDPATAIARGLEDRRRRGAAGLPEPQSQTGSFSTVTGGEMSVRGGDNEEMASKIADRIADGQREMNEALLRAIAVREYRLKLELEEKLKAHAR